MSAIIECNKMNFSYGEVKALRDFTISVERGEVLALLGPNGAGKTTSIRMLTGLFSCSSGF